MTGPRRPKRKRAGAPAPARRPRPRKPALGNDPFERGAAPREAAPAARAASARAQAAAAPAPPASGAPPTRSPAPATAPRAPPPVTGGVPAATPPASSAPSAAGEPPAAPPYATGAAARLRDVERRLDAALDGVEARLHDLAARSGVVGAPGELRHALERLLPALRARLAAAVDLVRLLEPPERLDRFGKDPRFAERLEPVVELLYATWWRTEVRDVDRVPSTGPAVVVANHAGGVPWDAFVLRHALAREHPARRDLRPLLDDRECALPVIGAAAIRYGAVRASPEAADRILAEGGVLGVFPEGSAVERRPWRDRYRIQRFGRGGFVKVALRAGAPIVPCAIVGSEEASPAIARTGWLAERLGLPLAAGSPSLRIAAAALLPLPSRWTLRFGAPVEVAGHGPDAAGDPGLVNELAERVRATLQAMLDEGVAARSSVYL